MPFEKVEMKVSTAGAGGAASGSAQSIHTEGRVIAVHVSYASNAPATTDLILRSADEPNEVILSLANVSTTGWYQPRKAIHTSVGSVVADQYDHYPIYGPLHLTVSGSDALAQAAKATIYLEK